MYMDKALDVNLIFRALFCEYNCSFWKRKVIYNIVIISREYILVYIYEWHIYILEMVFVSVKLTGKRQRTS